ncbi:hypothetical protein G7007_07950 [Pseudomonas entomophila]|uniref:hypothetical protein n=1 Tax=Pseudomonas entomophila TaxID=312306 RepID=UPI0015E3DDDB|nr:hypothetical protein [Pseudomonas entomophila]MBA1192791.1 hypothetical protein [Pseudomonas entomophila]
MGKCTLTRVIVIGLFLSWVGLQFTPVAVRSIEALRGNDASAQPEEQYTCGVFGEWIYRFPYSVFGGLAQYVGDDPWGEGLSSRDHTCTDRLVSRLFRWCWPEFKLAEYHTANAEKCFGVGMMLAPGKEEYLENILVIKNYYRFGTGKEDDYEKLLGLNYFYSKPIDLERVFWVRDVGGFSLVVGVCNIESRVPYCTFYAYSKMLGSRIEIRFPMRYLDYWKSFLLSNEESLKVYKYKKVEG